MITRVRLKDFLAHKDTVIELAPGVTVLTGPNNSGKSAVVEGLRCLASNPAPRFYIRHGAREARVEAWFDSGHRVAWIRREKYALYEVFAPGAEEPETFAKFGRKPPDEVLSILRLGPVEIEGADPVDVHIGDQRRPIFLLDQSGFVQASFFAASSESAHLLSMQRALKNREQEARRERRRVDERLTLLAGGLDALDGLPGLTLECEALAREKSVLDTTSAALPALAGTLDRVRGLMGTQGREAGRLKRLAPLGPPPSLADSRSVAGTLAALGAARGARTRQEARSRVLAELNPPPALHDAPALASRVRSLKAAGRTLENLDNRGRALAELTDPPELFPAAPLARTLDRKAGLEARAAKLERTARTLDPLAAPPVPLAFAPLAQLVRTLDRAGKRVAEAEKSALAAAGELAGFQESLSARLEEIGHCPVCGNRLTLAEFEGGECCP